MNLLLTMTSDSPDTVVIRLRESGPGETWATVAAPGGGGLLANEIEPLGRRDLLNVGSIDGKPAWYLGQHPKPVGRRLAAVLFGEPLHRVGERFGELLHAQHDRIVVLLRFEGRYRRELAEAPWELAWRPGLDEPLVHAGPEPGQHCELVRLVPGSGRVGPSADPGALLLDAVLAAPNEYEREAPFNPIPLRNAILAAGANAHWLPDKVTVEIDEPTWTRFCSGSALVKLFAGHGDAGTPPVLCFATRDASVQKVEVHELREHLSHASCAAVVLCACDSVHHVLRALDRPTTIRPRLIVACLDQVSVRGLCDALGPAVRRLGASGNVLELVRGLREAFATLDGQRPAVRLQGQLLALFHQPASERGHPVDDEALLADDRLGQVMDRHSLVPGGSARLGLSQRVCEALALRVQSGKYRWMSEGSLETTASGARTALQAQLFRGAIPTERTVEVAAFRMSRTRVTRWEYYALGPGARPSADEAPCPALATPQEAERYAASLGGRLPTPDEWEYAVAGPRATDDLLNGKTLDQLLAPAGWLVTKALAVTDRRAEAQAQLTFAGLVGPLGGGELTVEGGRAVVVGGGPDGLPLRALPQLRSESLGTERWPFRVVWPSR